MNMKSLVIFSKVQNYFQYIVTSVQHIPYPLLFIFNSWFHWSSINMCTLFKQKEKYFGFIVMMNRRNITRID